VSEPEPEPETIGSDLTPRQQRFVEEYIVSLNATQAAIRAGYSAETARAQGSRLLTNADIERAIASAKEARSKATGITAERVIEELAVLAFSDVTHYDVDDEGNVTLAAGAPSNAHRAISAIKRRISTDKDGAVTREVELKLWDKPGPLKLAGRHVNVAGFFDKVEVTGKDGGPVRFENLTTSERVARLGALIEKARTENEDGGEPDEAPGADSEAASS